MADDAIRQRLRAALNEAAANAEGRVRQRHDELDENVARRVALMKPVLAALEALSEELGSETGISINCAQHGHRASIAFDVQHRSISTSTTADNSAFCMDESWIGPDDQFEENQTKYSRADELLEKLVRTAATHVASKTLLKERITTKRVHESDESH